MIYHQIPLQGAYIFDLEPFRDQRGFFVRTYCKNEFSAIGHSKEFVQCNHSMTKDKGTLRGLHYQVPPSAEIKLVRCISGEVFDVIVDLRKGSKTFLKYFGVVLSEKNFKMIYVPEGFAHGFQTLKNNTQMIYHHTAFYSPEHETGIRYNDPSIRINWPLEPKNLTEKDQNYSLIDKNYKGIEL